jgi:hypothetical protein
MIVARKLIINQRGITMKNKILAVVAAIGLALGASAHAELVSNGGFETGDLTGWSGNGAFADNFEGTHSGSYAAYFGAVGQLDGISQTIATVAGTSYDFSFWYASDGGMPNAFQAYFDGNLLFSTANDPAHGYLKQDFIINASSNSTVISFLGRNDPTWQTLDDVSVNAATVPEPATTALVGLGLLGFTASRRKSANSKNA